MATLRHALLMWTALAAVLFAQNPPVEWRVGPDITTTDKSAIVELARMMGLEPRRIARAPGLPIACQVFTVASEPKVDGNRLTWTEVGIHRLDSRQCWPATTAGPRVGRWRANTEKTWTEQRWRIRDGDWHTDVPLDDDVAYADAERIVLAMHRKTLVNRMPDARGAPLPDFPAEAITSIRRRTGTTGAYIVTLGPASTGAVVSVSVADGRVMVEGQRLPGEI